MKRNTVGALLLALAATPFARGNADVGTDNVIAGPSHLSGEGVVIEGISPGFRIRTPGSNILVCEHGTDVAALYGVPLYPNNMTGLKIAYSINAGAVWSRYGPFGAGQSMQCAMDGPPNFCQTGGLAFIWSDGSSLNVMLEENTPSAPSFSVPLVLPNSQSPVMYPRNPDIAMALDDITNFVATAWSVFGNQWVYCWVSNDGGYTWTDTIPMAFIASDGASGCLSRGVDDYVLYAYLDYYTFAATDSVIYPYYIESTDGGYSWSSETPVPDVPINANSMFWWSEFDCLVINDEPWMIYADISDPGGLYLMHGTGGPGGWTWALWDAGQLGTCSLTIADTTFYCYPSQYPSLSYDPTSNTILASYKAYYHKECAGTIYYDGAHIGGVYTADNGANWTISQPLSDANTTQIPWFDWDATEVAPRLVSIAGEIWAYGIWVHNVQGALYFERGLVKPFSPVAVSEDTKESILHARLHVTPSITRSQTRIDFTLPDPAWVEIDLYDIRGRLVSTICQGHFSGGHRSIDLNRNDLPNGIYFVSLQTHSDVFMQKFVLMR